MMKAATYSPPASGASRQTAPLRNDVTGLHSHGGFVRKASRALHASTSDRRSAQLIYLELDDFASLLGASRLLPPRYVLDE